MRQKSPKQDGRKIFVISPHMFSDSKIQEVTTNEQDRYSFLPCVFHLLSKERSHFAHLHSPLPDILISCSSPQKKNLI